VQRKFDMNTVVNHRFSEEEEENLKNTLEEESSYFDFDDEREKIKFYKKLFFFLKYRTRDLYYDIKYKSQRIFRRNHLSDIDLWGFDSTMAEWIYPRLKAFINKKRHGYPGIFSEYNENEWENREKYNKAIAAGIYLGGGSEAWEKTLQEILFAFEWKLHFKDYSTESQRDNFCKKWNIKNPFTKNLENKFIHYKYKCLEPDLAFCISDKPDLDKKEPEKYSYTGRVVSYYNVKVHHEIQERAQRGFELFGKFFLSFWD